MRGFLILIFVFMGFNSLCQHTDSVYYEYDTNMLKDYDKAWAAYQSKDYQTALDIILPYYNNPKTAIKEIYQIVGNIYDLKGEKSKAVSVYTKGLEIYPKAGCLYLERGNIEFSQARYTQALYWYEKGIEYEPTFASNYYNAAKVFFLSTETIWGIMYGEIFMLLENNTDRTIQMSKDLYDAYSSSLTLEKDYVKADFCNNYIIYSDSRLRSTNYPKVFNEIMERSCKKMRFVTITNLIKMRENFVNILYKDHKDFANILTDYWLKLMESDNFSAYNYWLFGYGYPQQSATWIRQNKDKYDKMLLFLKHNPIPISSNNYFSRYLME